MATELLPGENPVLHLHRHWVLLVKDVFWPLVVLAAVLVLDGVVPARTVGSEVKLIVSLAVTAVVGLWLIVSWIRWVSSSLTLTDRRVILESGVFSRTTKVIALDRVQDVSTRQSLAGRVLGYGTILVDSAGARGAEELSYTPGPSRIRDQVFSLAESERRRMSGPAPAPPDL